MYSYEVNLICDNATCDGSILCSEPATSPKEGEEQVQEIAKRGGWRVIKGRWICDRCTLSDQF